MRYLSIILSLFLLTIVPGLAFSQEADPVDDVDNNSSIEASNDEITLHLPRTAYDNFHGLRLGANFMFGFGRCDDKMCFGQGEEQDWNAENTTWATMLQLEIGYLWGKEMFAGPVLNLHTGYPDLFGGDVRIMAIMPFSDKDAVTMSVGVGLEGFNIGRILDTESYDIYVSEKEAIGADGWPRYGEYTDELNWWIGQIYLPIHVGYEHVFDNGFTLGCALELKMRFNTKLNDYVIVGGKYDGSTIGTKETAHFNFYQFMAGIHIGYKI